MSEKEKVKDFVKLSWGGGEGLELHKKRNALTRGSREKKAGQFKGKSVNRRVGT